MAEKKPRQKKYKTTDGDYLVLFDDDHEGYRICWYIVDVADLGGFVGETDLRNKKQEDASKLDLEVWITDTTAEKFASSVDSKGFCFETKKLAQEALAAINAALFSNDLVRWPAWALQAKAAGWTPPEGWKP